MVMLVFMFMFTFTIMALVIAIMMTVVMIMMMLELSQSVPIFMEYYSSHKMGLSHFDDVSHLNQNIIILKNQSYSTNSKIVQSGMQVKRITLKKILWCFCNSTCT